MRKYLTKFALITSLLLLLGGCSVFERQEYEKRISRVSEVYPTEKVSDLFEKFPSGFEIYHRVKESKDGDYLFDHEIELVGNPNDKTISGRYKKVSMDDTVVADIPVTFDDVNGLITKENYEFDPIVKDRKFLFMILNLNKKKLEELKYMLVYSNPVLATYSIRYHITDPYLNNYLDLPPEKTLEITFGGHKKSDKDNRYQINIWIKDKLEDYLSERIVGY